ncbi:hypothetical protein [Tychonema sp. LEGE 07203]|uniref:hypothetical protein n=1 Tax=Tychonema sp. LEGE 07203 TaxID=1828671 RepID=UPI001881D4A4|nr:hypothetical protein [Tychonema sp. LEGE 07203]MBE9094368.1 hypothetical protein [Tychonema sp. LEGE 07203]
MTANSQQSTSPDGVTGNDIRAIFDRTGSPHHQIPNARPRDIQNPPPVKLAIAVKIRLL